MIPILYNKDETDFTHNGLGFLVDIIKATVPEARNGQYELSFRYPITGARFELITEGAIVKCKLDDSRGEQLFRIYKSSKPIKGIVTFSAEHISYDLNGLPLAGFSCAGVTPQIAIARALDDTPLEHGFTVRSDIATLNRTTIKEPCSVRGILGGREGSILDVWGGEYEFDNFEIILHEHRGADNGVSIEYGKNLTDITQEINISDCYTHIMPYAVYSRDDGSGGTEEIYVYLTEKVIPLNNAANLGHDRAFIYDCSGEFADDEVPTEAKIRIFANRYAAANDLVSPKVNIKVSFVNLADTLEYKDIAPLERVRLCDTVAVKVVPLGITAKAKVIETIYDVLNEKYESVTIGDAKSSFADTVNKQNTDISRLAATVAKDKSQAAIELENAIARATAAITGQSGGYVVLNPAEHPQEILILDAQSGGDIEQAVNVWRFNSGGLGFSSSGYDGTYSTAITMNGEIVADFIAAGTLNGELIRAGTVKTNAISSEFRQTITNEISGSASTLRQEFAAADGVLRSAIQSVETTLANDYSTTAQMQSAITQTASTIMTEVNSKVGVNEIGTKIVQNAASVKIAWNNLSQTIQFEGTYSNAQMNIYNGSNQKQMQLDMYGQHFYHKGTKVGKIGTNNWTGENNFRGLVFDLEENSNYMCWAHNEGEGYYDVKLMYLNGNRTEDIKTGNTVTDRITYAKGLHLWDKLYANGNLYLDGSHRFIRFRKGNSVPKSDDGVGYNGSLSFVRSTTSQGKTTHTPYIEFDGSKFSVWNGASVNFYSNVNMNGWSITNQSDVRLKKNLAPTQIIALNIVNAVDMYEFDWIGDNTHVPIGIMAQQLQAVAPQLVGTDERGFLFIKTSDMIMYLWKAIQELSTGTYPKAPFNENDYIKVKPDLAPTGAGDEYVEDEEYQQPVLIPIEDEQENETEETE